MLTTGTRVAYLLSQAVLVAAWWIALVLAPAVRGWFVPTDAPDYLVLAFWLADLVCVVFGSAVAAWAVHGRHTGKALVLSFTSGALVYGLLYCVALSMLTGEAWPGVLLMAPATILTLLITRAESR
jgi:hypothetical protein